jgi:glycosyltransferase involved in cell wall biosynthesis
MCDPFDYTGFAKKIESLLNDNDYRQNTIQQGMAQAAKFTWGDVAKKTIDVYKLVNRRE